MKIACVGDFGLDYYQKLNVLKPGGIAFNFAYNLKALGAKEVSLVSTLGNDVYSEKLLKLLKKVQIGSSCVQKLKGVSPKQNILLSQEGERKFTGYEPGVLKKWKLRKKDLDFIKKQDAIFVPLSDGIEAVFNDIKKIKGPIKAVDFSQDYEFADFDKKQNLVTKNTKYFDVIFLGGSKKQEKMIKKLSLKFPKKVFVLTLGAKGSVAYTGGKKYFQPAKTVKIIDTTGAGDAFQAGFLYSWLAKSDMTAALADGTNRAAVIIKNIGSTPLILK